MFWQGKEGEWIFSDGRKGMVIRVNEYIKVLLEQIRCRKAWSMVEGEMKNHILDQAEANRLQGMEEKEALEEAVRDMGDPVEAGVALDRIHRPQMEWGMLVLIGAISLLSIFAQWMLGKADASLGQEYGIRHAAGVILGYLVMLAVYRVDYSYIGKYAKQIGAVFCAFVFLIVFGMGREINGARVWISLGGWNISVIFLMYLFIPIYGALMYQYRGMGWKGLGKCFVWMLLPILAAWKIPCMSLTLALFLMMSIMLSIAVCRGWFSVCGKKLVAAYWILAAVLPVGLFLSVGMGHLPEYQQERIKAFLGMESSYVDYAGGLAAEYIKSSRLIGGSGREIVDWLPEFGSDYILVFLAVYCGIAVAFSAGLLILAIAAKTIRIAFGQKNQLGMMMGCGCGLVFEMMPLMGILRIFGLIPATQTFFPFLSGSQAGVIVSYILAGIILSIYRYRNILPREKPVFRQQLYK